MKQQFQGSELIELVPLVALQKGTSGMNSTKQKNKPDNAQIVHNRQLIRQQQPSSRPKIKIIRIILYCLSSCDFYLFVQYYIYILINCYLEFIHQ